MSAKHTPAFSVQYLHRGFGSPCHFIAFRRDQKLEAFACLRRLSQAWPNTTYFLKRERKTIARIERGEIHYPRGHVVRRAREQFRAQCAAIAQATGSAA